MRYGLAALTLTTLLSTGAAFAQSADAPPPPPGTIATSRETHAVDAYGNRTDSASSTYRSANGAAQETQTTTTQVAPPPPPPPVTSSTTTTRTTTTTGDPN